MIDKVPCFDGADVLVGGGWLVGLCCFVWSDGVGKGCRSHLVEGQRGTGKGPEGGGDQRGCLPNRLYLIFCRRNTTFDRNLLRTHAGGVNSIRAGFRMVWAFRVPATPRQVVPALFCEGCKTAAGTPRLTEICSAPTPGGGKFHPCRF